MRRICVLVVAWMLAGGSGLPSGGAATAQAPATKRWIVIYQQQGRLPADADRAVEDAGGVVFDRLPEVGMLGAHSAAPDFAARMERDPRVSYVVEDRLFPMLPPVRGVTAFAAGDGPVEAPGSDAQTGSEPFYPFQWDKKRMRASNQGSYAVQQGRPEVVVAVLDTGAQVLPTPHPDIVPNLDVARSRSFYLTGGANGDPNPAAWDDRNGHGSWCLSAIAAPINGIGMSGVAPRVRLVALKVIGDDGSGNFLAIARALIYSGVNKFDVASMSFGAYLPRSDASSHIYLEILRRSLNFARSNGVTPVAAIGNESLDVSDGNLFRDYLIVPGEMDGVIGVSATGYFNLKASYSNYGVGKVDVSAPGGDIAVQAPSAAYPGLGGVLGAWASDNTAAPGADYVFASGTSMAAPNAAGVVALIISQFGDFTPDNSQKAHMSPQAVEARLQQTANNQPCPEPSIVTYHLLAPPAAPDTPVPDVQEAQQCAGGPGSNGFYGKGIVDALKAVVQ
jgi:lantibiotic leader peptide-processing serine protease